MRVQDLLLQSRRSPCFVANSICTLTSRLAAGNRTLLDPKPVSEPKKECCNTVRRCTLSCKSQMWWKPTSQSRSRTGARRTRNSVKDTLTSWSPTSAWVSGV
ncbi:hypothetical protein PO909_032710 [Leuciscus waleckii]